MCILEKKTNKNWSVRGQRTQTLVNIRQIYEKEYLLFEYILPESDCIGTVIYMSNKNSNHDTNIILTISTIKFIKYNELLYSYNNKTHYCKKKCTLITQLYMYMNCYCVLLMHM